MKNKKTINDFEEEEFDKASVYFETIEDEIAKPLEANMFMGAWYHKCISQKDTWLGIEAMVTLPEFYCDVNRLEFFEHTGFFREKKLKPFLRAMDSPSVYLGGNAGYETDIGFGYGQGFLDEGCMALSPVKNCFKPFWRYIHPDETGKEKNTYCSSSLEDKKMYFYPGDKLLVRVICTKENFLRLKIKLLEPTNELKYRKLRKNLGVDENEQIVFESPLIPSIGQGVNLAEFKKVNAIDQFYNEGKRNKNTESYTTDTIWHEVYLFRIIDDKIYKVPFIETRYNEINCPVEDSVIKKNNVTEKKLGGEEVSIDPRKVLF